MTFKEKETTDSVEVTIALCDQNALLLRRIRFWRLYGLLLTVSFVVVAFRAWSR